MIKSKAFTCMALATIFLSLKGLEVDNRYSQAGRFNIGKDLLLGQFDCKTDVDDLHTVAAFATLLTASEFSKVKYHAVAGTYGLQEGLYVPPNALFQMAFGDRWTDAHNSRKTAVQQVKELVKATLNDQGDVWIAEAGQSDFSAELIKAVQIDLPEINIQQRIHIVQHSNWNEESTSPKSLKFVKENADYQKIPDGNAVGNGTPGFRDPEYTFWKTKIEDPLLSEIWQLATDLSKKYNGKDGRYNNEAIASNGLDFSDLSEVCWILGIEDIEDATQFFDLYAK